MIIIPVKNPQTEEEWLECIPLPEYLAKIPAGHILTVAGDETWIDGNGLELDRDSYIMIHGVDPVVVQAAKEKYLATTGKGVHYVKK